MSTSELVLEETPYLNLTTRGRKTGLKHDVELWFAFEDGRLYFLAYESSHWWKEEAPSGGHRNFRQPLHTERRARKIPEGRTNVRDRERAHRQDILGQEYERESGTSPKYH